MPGQEHLKELHYICPIANVPSIVEHGILSHNQATRFVVCFIPMADIAD